ncbi:MAG: glycosyl transferase, partial [Chloroflexi bacterium]|nr:glycosyl transferase [Chloroflexota bacterium]
IALLGYDLQPSKGRWSLTLYWQAVQGVDKDYTVFVHLVGPDGQIWAQHDAPPGGGFFPTSFWQSGDTVADTHELTLPADAPAGTYRLLAGLYDPGSGARLPVRTGSAGPADHLTLSTFFLNQD